MIDARVGLELSLGRSSRSWICEEVHMCSFSGTCDSYSGDLESRVVAHIVRTFLFVLVSFDTDSQPNKFFMASSIIYEGLLAGFRLTVFISCLHDDILLN